MIPGAATVNTVPKRPRFARKAKSLPWMDDKGIQERYKLTVEDWKGFSDYLPDANPNKLWTAFQGIVFKSQLYGEAADQIADTTKEELKFCQGMYLIGSVVYRRDFISVIL